MLFTVTIIYCYRNNCLLTTFADPPATMVQYVHPKLQLDACAGRAEHDILLFWLLMHAGRADAPLHHGASRGQSTGRGPVTLLQ